MGEVTQQSLELLLTAKNEATPVLEETSKAMEELLKNITSLGETTAEAMRPAIEQVTALSEAISAAAQHGTATLYDFSTQAKMSTEQIDELTKGLQSTVTEATAVGEESAQGLKPIQEELRKIVEDAITAKAEIADIGGEQVNIPAGGATEEATKTEEVAPSEEGRNRSHNKGGLFSMDGQMDAMYAGMALTGFATPIIAGFTQAIKKASEFDQAMRNVNTMMQLPESQFQTMKEKVMDLSQTLPFSATEMAQGLYKVYSANVPLSDSLGFTKTAAEAAGAGLGNMDDSVLALTETIKGYGANWSDAQHVSDLMFQTIKDGQTTFPELSKSIGTVASMAHESGVSMQELMASYATLTGVTGNTAEVTTQLSGIYKEIIHPSKAASKEAASLGLEFSASAVQSEGFATWLQHVADKTHGNAEELGKLFPNVRALRGMMALTTTQLGTYNSKLGDMQHASDGAGQTAIALKQAMAGQADQFKLFQNHLEKIGELASQALLPAINALMPAIENFMGFMAQHPTLTAFATGALAVAAGFAAIGAAAAFAISGFDALKSVGDRLNGIFSNTETAADGAAKAIMEEAVACDTLSGNAMAASESVATMTETAVAANEELSVTAEGTSLVGEGLTTAAEGAASVGAEMATAAEGAAALGGGAEVAGGALALLGGPVTLVIAGVATLAFGLYKAYQNSETFRKGVDGAVNAVENAAHSVKEWFWGKDYAADIKKASNQSVADVVTMANTTEAKLVELKATSGAITKDTANSVVAASNDMKDKVISFADQRLQQETKDAQLLQQNLKGITSQQVSDMIKKAQEQHNQTVAEAQKMNQEVTAQVQAMEKAGVHVTEQMKDEIIKKFEQQRDGAVQALSDSEVKAKAVLEMLKHHSGQITDEVASQTIKNANKQRDGAVAAANDQYQKTVEAVIRMRDQDHIITSQQADQMIAQAQRQRDGAVNKAEDMRNQVVGKVQSMMGSSKGDVDSGTGDILSGWDKFVLSMEKKTQGMASSVNGLINSIFGKNVGTGIEVTLGTYQAAIPAHAKGTDNFQGGLTLVGEEGPEIVNLPRGSQIIPNGKSESMLTRLSSNWAAAPAMSGGATVINVYASGNIARNENDLADIIARRLLSKMKLQGRVPR